MPVVVYPRELAHHGILGMKWGVRNGPPYPLSQAKHDKVVASSDKAPKSKSGGSSEDSMAAQNWGVIQDLTRDRDVFQKRDRELPLSSLKRSNKVADPAHPTVAEASAISKEINPHRTDKDAYDKGYFENCVKCAVCTDLQLRGYDARAYAMENNVGHVSGDYLKVPGLGNSGAYDPSTVSHCRMNFGGSVPEKQQGFSAVGNSLYDGDRGLLSLQSRSYGFNHNVNFLKAGRELYVIDSQYGECMPASEYVKQNPWIDAGDFYLTTNAKLTGTGVGRYVDESCFEGRR